MGQIIPIRMSINTDHPEACAKRLYEKLPSEVLNALFTIRDRENLKEDIIKRLQEAYDTYVFDLLCGDLFANGEGDFNCLDSFIEATADKYKFDANVEYWQCVDNAIDVSLLNKEVSKILSDRTYIITNIKWNTEDTDINDADLPSEVKVSDINFYNLDDVENWLSDQFECTVDSYNIDVQHDKYKM